MAKYINDNRFTDSVIEEILNKCGLEIIKNRYDERTGEKMKGNGIIRGEETIMVSCKNNEDAEMAQIIMNRFPAFSMFAGGAYQVGDEFVMFDDFFASRMKMNDELEPLDQKLFDEYHNTMCQIFGKEYQEDAEREFDRIRAEEKTAQHDLAENEKTEENSNKNEGSQMGE